MQVLARLKDEYDIDVSYHKATIRHYVNQFVAAPPQ